MVMDKLYNYDLLTFRHIPFGSLIAGRDAGSVQADLHNFHRGYFEIKSWIWL